MEHPVSAGYPGYEWMNRKKSWNLESPRKRDIEIFSASEETQHW